MSTRERLVHLVKDSCDIIHNVVAEHPLSKIGISFNGGKDSVLMMELLLKAEGEEFFSNTTTFVLDETDEFNEMAEFRDHYMKKRLPKAKWVHIPALGGLADGLWTVKERFDIDVVFLGTRSSDFSGKYLSGPCEPTTAGWPSMLRVCPLFHWTFHDVWEYTLTNKVMYCSLYNDGYTSLGSQSTTIKSPALKRENGEYLPAWMLPTDSAQLERAGRSTMAKQAAEREKLNSKSAYRFLEIPPWGQILGTFTFILFFAFSSLKIFSNIFPSVKIPSF